MAKAIIQQQVDRLIYAMIGTILTMPVQQVPETCMICDGSLVLFEDWPEFKAAYDSGKFTGMVLDSADSAQVGKLVLNGSTGLYLPDLEGLFVQASAAGTAGAYIAPGLPNITGGVATGAGIKTEYNDPHSAMYGGDDYPAEGITTGSQPGNIYFDASRNNAIYGASTTVQPPAVQYVIAMYLGKPAAAA